jgi:hypothetical protein
MDDFFDGATAKAVELDAAPSPAPAPARTVVEDNEFEVLTVEPCADVIAEHFAPFQKDASVTLNKTVARRIALAYMYIFVDIAPPPEDWECGKIDYYVEKLRERLKIPQGSKSRMKSDLLDIAECYANGETYNPNIVYSASHGKPAPIKLDSDEAQIIADASETGMSGRLTQQLVNMHRIENDEEPYSFASVLTAVKSLKPRVVQVGKRK